TAASGPTPDARNGSKAQLRRREVITRISALVVTGLAVYVVLPSLSAVFGAWPRLASLSAAWLLIALFAEIGSFVCNFGTQRIVLRTRQWFPIVTAGLAGNAVTNTLPGGDAAGAAVQFRMLATAGVNTDAAAGGLAASSLLGIGGLLMLPVLSLPTVLGTAGVSHTLMSAAFIGVAGFLVYLALGIVLLRTERPLRMLGRALQWLWNKIRRPRSRVVGLGDRLVHQRNEIRAALGREWKQVFVLVVGRLALDYLCLLAALRATGSQPRIWLVLLAYSAAGVIALFPVTPGGLGIVEASLSGLLVLAGVKSGSAVVAILAYRLDQYWLPTLAGAFAYWLFRRRYRPAFV
ncbi:MAG: flippase-like domain-containing protein, partial [Acidimicrobiales bacterium]|nr:flippase-like domain-containing protein [Acidimicrobiales bacterium]